LKKITIFIFCLLLVAFADRVVAQTEIAGTMGISPENLERFQIMEDSMLVTIDSAYNAFIPDNRFGYCERFVKQLVRTLKIERSYLYKFDKLKDKINITVPDDNAFRIFNWDIAPTDNTLRYYGAIQMNAPTLKLYPLIDYSDEMKKGAEDSVLTGSKWLGALYYRIITHDADGHKVYTLFGVNGTNTTSNRKFMDPLILTAEGPVFGAPIFDIKAASAPRKRINRFILEYKKEVQAGLNWDEERQMVIFDKLVSQVNDPNRKYTFVPSGAYDGFKWEIDHWVYQPDVIPILNLKDGEAPQGNQPEK
jgi:hypothetical protein